METAGTESNPIWMKLIRDEKVIKWGSLAVMLAFTVISGYLASQSQRIGGDADYTKTLRMRYHVRMMKLAGKQETYWLDVLRHHHDMYELARL